MASYSVFLRKAPTARLKSFLLTRGLAFPAEFDWNSAGRGTAFVSDLNALIDDLPTLKQDRVKAELDHLASLSIDAFMVSAEQVCPKMGIDLEGLEGVQDVLLMLALDHPRAFERVAVQASLNRRTGGRNWSAFQFDDDGKAWGLEDDAARAAFVTDAIGILNLPAHRKREADWYRAVRHHPITGEETEIVQATIYVEDRAASELTFGPSEGLERQVFQRVLEVGIACNPTERVTGVSDRTIRAWIKQGLTAMSDERPTLVRGDALISFIQNQRRSRKSRLSPDEFYCLKCRAARKPAGGLVDCETDGTRAKLTALCKTCDTIMHKPVAHARVVILNNLFDVTLRGEAPETPKDDSETTAGNRH